MSNIIKLSVMEVKVAALISVERLCSNMSKGKTMGHGYDKQDEWEVGVQGAGAEVAVAKFLNVAYCGHCDVYHSIPDIGVCTEVRWTRLQSLIVRPIDEIKSNYIVVTGRVPEMNIIGWMSGAEAKQDRYLTDFGNSNRPKCYGIPFKDLHHMNTYPKIA